jgi:hypothetical protein
MKPSEARELWQQRVEAQLSSGLTVKEFCSREGIPYFGLRTWRRRLAGDRIVRRKVRTLVPLKVSGVNSAAAGVSASHCLEIRLKGDRRIVVHDEFVEASLARLVRLLEQLPC